ncbi:MAG: hypothetical protein ABI273_07825 [Lacunisphaera sp.]
MNRLGDFQIAARAAPVEYVEHIIPAVMRVAQRFAEPALYAGGLQPDLVWSPRYNSAYPGFVDCLLHGCETAFEQLGGTNLPALLHVVEQLKPHHLHAANDLVLQAFACAPAATADAALQLLTQEPARRHAGTYDSSYWIARVVIERCSPHCTEDTFQTLEQALLGFVPDEESEPGAPNRGHAAYTLALGLAPARLGPAMRTKLDEWKHYFPYPPSAPGTFRMNSAVSPIEKATAEIMSDMEWLDAMQRYSSEQPRFERTDQSKGGAYELSAMMQEFVKKEPQRFADVALRFPTDTAQAYWVAVLNGIKGTSVAEPTKIELVRRNLNKGETLSTLIAIDLLGEIRDGKLSPDLIAKLNEFGRSVPTKLADGSGKLNLKEILTAGLGTVRAHAMRAMSALVFTDNSYLEDFSTTIEWAIADREPAMRAAAGCGLIAIAAQNETRALELFTTYIGNEPQLYASGEAQQLVRHAMRKNLETVRSHIRVMLESESENVRENGGVCACLARLHHSSAEDLAEAAFTHDIATRKGATAVAKDNLLHPDCFAWCVMALTRLFCDPETEIRAEAARSFWALWKNPDDTLAAFETLIRSFLASPAFADEPSFLLHTLDETRAHVPGLILDTCEAFIAHCAEEARDITRSIAADEPIVGTLVFRAYAQLKEKPEQRRALDLIDRMCASGLKSANKQLVEYDR